MPWCFLGNFGDNKRQNLNIFLECGRKVGAGCGSACLPFIVSTGVGVSGSLCYFADVSKIGQDTAGCSAFLPALSLCLWCAVLEYGSISHFKGVFSAVWGFGVGLCCLGALRGLCGFLCACGVRRFKGLKRICLSFFFFCPCVCSPFMLFAYLLGLCLCCPRLVLLYALFVLVCLWSLLFPFPFRYIRKKKGRKDLSLRPLLSCCVNPAMRCPPFTPFPFQVSANTLARSVCSYSAFLQ